MKRALLCALLISMIGVTAWTQDLPAQLPEMVDWTATVSGGGQQSVKIRLANADVEYILYVDPARPMLYSVTHFEVTPRIKAGVFDQYAQGYRRHEAICWLASESDGRYHIRIFVKRFRLSWRSLWLRKSGYWQELPEPCLSHYFFSRWHHMPETGIRALHWLPLYSSFSLLE